MIYQRTFFFFFNDTATTEIYTLSLHDALPISRRNSTSRPLINVVTRRPHPFMLVCMKDPRLPSGPWRRTSCNDVDRKSTRLNSSHANISYAVFCLKKKNIYRDFHNQKQRVRLF